MHPCSVSVVSYYIMHTHDRNDHRHSQSAWSEIWRSQMISQAGGGDGNVWYKLVHANLLGWGLQSLGGEMKNNVNPITKTP